MTSRAAFELTIRRPPDVLARAMLSALSEPDLQIPYGAFVGGEEWCPVIAACDWADEHDEDASDEWDPAWGTKRDFHLRVMDFVCCFDAFVEVAGREIAIRRLRQRLRQRLNAPPV
jgi:hypothetical protein